MCLFPEIITKNVCVYTVADKTCFKKWEKHTAAAYSDCS